MKLKIAMLLFERLTQLDLTGPYEVFCRMPHTSVELVGKTQGPVTSEHGMKFIAEVALDETGQYDIIMVPGGFGVNALLEDEAVIAFLQRQAPGARYITSVCTGALVLGAAGLLKGKQATTHWLSLPFLKEFGAQSSEERFVKDGKIVTGGGVTAGIDFALLLAAEIFGSAVAEEIQLMIEYNPAPPSKAGHPSVAPAEIVKSLSNKLGSAQQKRAAIVKRAAAKLV